MSRGRRWRWKLWTSADIDNRKSTHRGGFSPILKSLDLFHGFTLIELMVVLALVAILGTIAAPSLKTLIETNRVASEVNGFVADMQFTRSEAIKRGLPVIICPSSNSSSCLGSNTWGGGWIVFVDSNSSGAFDTGEEILRVRPAWKGNDQLSVATPAASPPVLVSFSRDGFASLSGVVQFQLETSPVNASASRCISLNIAGRISTLPGACT